MQTVQDSCAVSSWATLHAGVNTDNIRWSSGTFFWVGVVVIHESTDSIGAPLCRSDTERVGIFHSLNLKRGIHSDMFLQSWKVIVDYLVQQGRRRSHRV